MKKNDNLNSRQESHGLFCESLLNALFELSNDALCISDSSGHIKAHNQLFGLVLGKPETTMVGTDFSTQFIFEKSQGSQITESTVVEISLRKRCIVRIAHSDGRHQVAELRSSEIKGNLTTKYFLHVLAPVSIHHSASPASLDPPLKHSLAEGKKSEEEELDHSENSNEGKIESILRTGLDIAQIERDQYDIKLLIDNAEESFVMIDKNLDIINFNEPFSSFYRKYFNKDVQRGQCILEYALPHRRDAVQDIYQRVFQGERESFEMTLPTDDGKDFTSLIRYKPALDQGGTIIGAFVTITDVTEKKQAEEQLKMSERRFKALVQQGADLTTIVDGNGSIIYLSPNHGAILGHTAEEMYGLDLNALIHEAERKGIANFFQSAQGNERRVSAPYRFRHKDGSWRWLQSAVTDLSHDDAVGGVVIHTVDITHREEIAEELRLSNERFEKVSEATNDGIWDWNLKDNTLYWGEGFRTLFGHNLLHDEINIESWENNIHPDDRDRVMKGIYASIANKSANFWQSNYRFRRSDSSYAHIADRGIVMRDSKGFGLRMVGAMTDISERVEYEASLRKLNHTLKQKTADLSRSNAELEQFAYIASHDLQEPLRMITSFLAQLEKHYGHLFDEKARRYIFFAVDGAKRMRQIILDLLEFSRVGRSDSKIEEVDLNDVMFSLTTLFKKRISENRACIEYPELPRIRTNRSAIRCIFQNLLDNALKYHKEAEPPRIKISFESNAEGYEFCFQDDGIGMNKDYFDKIFIIFQRLHPADHYPGTGMGLAVAKKTVEYLNGKIWVESEEGRGTKFFVFHPLL